MLVHFGRGQMAAEQGLNFAIADVPAVILGNANVHGTEIFERPIALPGGVAAPGVLAIEGVVERMFRVFTESIAANNQAGVFANNGSVRNKVCAYSFLLGNLAWQNRGAADNLTGDNVKANFEEIQKTCSPTGTAGGGDFCNIGPF
jgi:hypothetical protein